MKDYFLQVPPRVTLRSVIEYLDQQFERNQLPLRAETDEANNLTVTVYPNPDHPMAPDELRNYVGHLLAGLPLQPEIHFVEGRGERPLR